MKLGMFDTNDVLSGGIPGLRWNDHLGIVYSWWRRKLKYSSYLSGLDLILFVRQIAFIWLTIYWGLAPTLEYTQTKIHNTIYLVCSQHGQKQRNLVSVPFWITSFYMVFRHLYVTPWVANVPNFMMVTQCLQDVREFCPILKKPLTQI